VPELLLVVDEERRRALLVEGGEALQLAPRLLQFHAPSDHLGHRQDKRLLKLIRAFPSRTRSVDPATVIDRSVPGKLRTVRLPALTTLIRIGSGAARGFFAFEEVPAMGSRDCAALEDLGSKLQFDDPINIQFTSGTTGTPKGATLTHHNILNNGYFVGEAIRLTEHDRVCIPVPLYHCFGMILGNLACISHGAVMVYPSEGFDALAALETVAAERCTALYGVPTMFIAELGHPRFKDSDLTSASRCPSDLMSTRRCNTAPKLRPS
jgi:fatty-acyl-CoA synthase